MIKTKNLTLRLFQDEEDVRQTLKIYNDLSERSIHDHQEVYSANKLLERFQENGLWSEKNGVLLITDSDNRILGQVGFQHESEFSLEVGYRIYRQADRGRGIMTQALKLFSAYLFHTKPILRLTLRIAVDNLPSRKLAEKCGFQQEGVMRNAYFYLGKQVDFVIYGMLREESPEYAELLEEMQKG